MAELNLDNASFARSEKGRKDYIQTYNIWLNNYKRDLTGDKFQALLNAISEAWVGADADAFKVKLNDIAHTLAVRVNKYAQIAEQTLNEDAARFDRVQNSYARDVNNINTSL